MAEFEANATYYYEVARHQHSVARRHEDTPAAAELACTIEIDDWDK